MTSKYEYQVIDLDSSTAPAGVTEAERIATILNEHGARGWELDRLMETSVGARILLRKVTVKNFAGDSRLSVFA
jgi:hypothetical protein